MSFTTSKILISTALLFSLAACGPGIPALPDDPENEPVAAAGEMDMSSLSEVSEQSTVVLSLSEREQILKKYDYVDPDKIVPTRHLEEALLYYDKNKTSLKNQNVLSVIDFGQKSTQKRWYLITMSTGAVWNIHVSHGKGSDSDHDGFAEKFSNVSGSNATSLGFYRTAETYSGNHGYSLRLDGLSSTNSRARARAIVIHGASYVQDSAVIQGRSWGCPAVSSANRTKVINLIKGGSLIYAAGK